MLFARLRRSMALFVCPELDWQARSKAVMRKLEESGVVERLAKESQLRIQAGYPVVYERDPVVARGVQNLGEPGQTFPNRLNAGVIAGEQDRSDGNPDLHKNAQVVREALFNGALFSHVSSPVGVGTSQGKEASGPAIGETQPGRRLDGGRIEDVVGCVLVFALPVIVLTIGALIDGGM